MRYNPNRKGDVGMKTINHLAIQEIDFEAVNKKSLMWIKYKYEHCNGECDRCPVCVCGYDCSTIYDETIKELDEREKRA